MHDDARLPRLAWPLGLGGLLPFLAAAAAAIVPDWRAAAVVAGIGYGAVILSFLGAVHWGLALAAPPSEARATAPRLALGVVPGLIGWVALLLPPQPAAAVLAAALMGTIVAETAVARHGWLPLSYLRLRWVLSLGAVASLLTLSIFHS